MESVLQWVKLVAISLTVLILVLKVTVLLWWRPKRIEDHFSRQGIRGPPYHFFNGNVKELVGMVLKASSQPMPLSHNILPRVLSFYHHWRKIYGATFLLWFGPTVRLTVVDPDLPREIFTSKSDSYEKNEAHPLMKQLEGEGLLSLKGEKWAHHRNHHLKCHWFQKKVTDMLDKWSAMPTSSGVIEIEVCEWLTLTEDVIGRTAFGTSYEDGKAIFVYKLNKWEIKKSLMKLIERRKENLGNIVQEKGPKYLLGLMLQASNSCPNITVHDIIEECKSFFFAGKQTTSILLSWTTILLAMHPQWQVQAREEVLRVCGSRDIPSKDDVLKLKTEKGSKSVKHSDFGFTCCGVQLTMILNKSLQLYLPTIATIRRAKVDAELGGYMIPRGTELLIPILAVHHDQVIWGNDANEFNPARFSEGVARAAKHPVGFIPFGLGVRTCIGQNLAILQAKLALLIILQRFSFRLAPTYQHAPTVLMLLYPQYGAPIIFQPLPESTIPQTEGSWFDPISYVYLSRVYLRVC
ncbi:CYP734A6 protein [Hibiscus syriacus]|uniref:CYP734A6 protein n=1 Tax=Hibiscus syriacus TaxID=106335 RepID=A0A6A3CRF7_HIBSY|nr:CYP734A6 protein [Hibiscus syriacus]